MQVIQIVTSEVEWIFLHLLYFNIFMLETLYLVYPDPQRKIGPRCHLLPMYPNCQSR